MLLFTIVHYFITQVFVETLDKCFENVCELDLIFHMDKVSFQVYDVHFIMTRATFYLLGYLISVLWCG